MTDTMRTWRMRSEFWKREARGSYRRVQYARYALIVNPHAKRGWMLEQQ